MCVVHGVKLHSLGGWELSYTILDLQSLFHVVLPLQLEVGRWINKAIEERLCLICNNGTVKLLNNGHPFCRGLVAVVDECQLLRGCGKLSQTHVCGEVKVI